MCASMQQGGYFGHVQIDGTILDRRASKVVTGAKRKESPRKQSSQGAIYCVVERDT